MIEVFDEKEVAIRLRVREVVNEARNGNESWVAATGCGWRKHTRVEMAQGHTHWPYQGYGHRPSDTGHIPEPLSGQWN